MSAKWIWYSGDFEIYHSMLLHTRRTEYDHPYPAMWRVPRPELICCFRRRVRLPEPRRVYIHAKGEGYAEMAAGPGGKRLGAVNAEVALPAGEYTLAVHVQNLAAFPAVFIDSPGLETDESWTADLPGQAARRPAACEPAMTSPADDPAVFPFSYRPIAPARVERLPEGDLYDFGVESFGPATIGRSLENGRISVYYGESREEALDEQYAYLRERLPAGEGEITLAARAFRYILVRAERGRPVLRAALEYLPLEDVASFACDDERIPAIWEISARAFHLNSREFLLDGVKRDRWLWAGDAYQSYEVNRYLYNDPAITRRTLRAALGKLPYIQHLNTINDYSAYTILAVRDYWFASGDAAFVAEVFERVSALYAFIVGRLERETGYVVARPGDWVFIDWADLDKDGPLCAEQILLYAAHRAMAELSAVVARYERETGRAVPGYQPDREECLRAAEALRESILRDFWDREAGAFIDTYASGRRHITRHANIFAILYELVDAPAQEGIAERVLLTDRYAPITTPFFKLFELMALAKLGHMAAVQDYIRDYWGGMLDNGATSAWEEYIPTRSGPEHYEMYGDRFGCSLCHAWGAGPILLLGKYCAGVTPTSVGAGTFLVEPRPGRYRRFEAVVPIGKGRVRVRFGEGRVRALADVPGGTLRFNGKSAALPVGMWTEL